MSYAKTIMFFQEAFLLLACVRFLSMTHTVTLFRLLDTWASREGAKCKEQDSRMAV